MNAPLTARKFSINRRSDDVIKAEAELSNSCLAIEFNALLDHADEVWRVEAEKLAQAAGQRRHYQVSREGKLAARLLNQHGSSRDNFTICEAAKAYADEVAEREQAVRW